MKCSVRVYGDRVRDWPCRLPGVVQRDGKWYCRVHDPEKTLARHTKSRLKYDIEMALLDLRLQREGLGRDVVNRMDPASRYEDFLPGIKRVQAAERKLARLRKQLG